MRCEFLDNTNQLFINFVISNPTTGTIPGGECNFVYTLTCNCPVTTCTATFFPTIVAGGAGKTVAMRNNQLTGYCAPSGNGLELTVIGADGTVHGGFQSGSCNAQP